MNGESPLPPTCADAPPPVAAAAFMPPSPRQTKGLAPADAPPRSPLPSTPDRTGSLGVRAAGTRATRRAHRRKCRPRSCLLQPRISVRGRTTTGSSPTALRQQQVGVVVSRKIRARVAVAVDGETIRTSLICSPGRCGGRGIRQIGIEGVLSNGHRKSNQGDPRAALGRRRRRGTDHTLRGVGREDRVWRREDFVVRDFHLCSTMRWKLSRGQWKMKLR